MFRHICSVFLRCIFCLGFAVSSVPQTLASIDAESEFTGALNHRVETEALRLIDVHGAPGVVVAITFQGKHQVFNFGVASRQTGAPVANDTLFEIGAISETFSGLLAAYAHQRGMLSLFDEAGDCLPAMKDSLLGRVSVFEIATHARRFELFLSNKGKAQDPFMSDLTEWKARHSSGTSHLHPDLGALLLGRVTSEAFNMPYAAAIRSVLLPQLGLAQTFLEVPAGAQESYAQGYTVDDKPVRQRLTPQTFAANGIKTTAGELIRYVEAHLTRELLDPEMQQAIEMALTGYARVGPFTRTLMWEQYAYPVSLERLTEGSSIRTKGEDELAVRLNPPFPPREKVLLSKAGATDGFTAYVAFVPIRRTGIALLVNKSIPEAELLGAAYRILEMGQDPQP
ncbi:serine hydrolase [Nitratireductor sp. GISD-1A_MAKvit]|uniref:serine hydrolase n=1 Tax=Nitratireductor sp. GISD-1A_MAKvit TaxID=3234198 RepID=UPI0034673C11